MDWTFQTASLAAFCADLKACCLAKGCVNPDGSAMLVDTAADGSLSAPCVRCFPDLRIDLDWIDNLVGKEAVVDGQGNVTMPAILRGPHCNARGSLLPGGNPMALVKLDADLQAYFAPLPLVTQDTPAAM